jgi:hypothetical protein
MFAILECKNQSFLFILEYEYTQKLFKKKICLVKHETQLPNAKHTHIECCN